MGSSPVFIEGAFDLHPSGLEEVSEGGIFLPGVNSMETLLADNLANELGGMRHNLVTLANASAAGPEILC